MPHPKFKVPPILEIPMGTGDLIEQCCIQGLRRTLAAITMRNMRLFQLTMRLRDFAAEC